MNSSNSIRPSLFSSNTRKTDFANLVESPSGNFGRELDLNLNLNLQIGLANWRSVAMDTMDSKEFELTNC